jgi:hypothetical protein
MAMKRPNLCGTVVIYAMLQPVAKLQENVTWTEKRPRFPKSMMLILALHQDSQTLLVDERDVLLNL